MKCLSSSSSSASNKQNSATGPYLLSKQEILLSFLPTCTQELHCQTCFLHPPLHYSPRSISVSVPSKQPFNTRESPTQLSADPWWLHLPHNTKSPRHFRLFVQPLEIGRYKVALTSLPELPAHFSTLKRSTPNTFDSDDRRPLPVTMRFSAFLTAVLTVVSGVVAVDQMKSVIIWTDKKSVTQDMIDRAKAAIIEAQGQITHTYNMLDNFRGFAAIAPAKALDDIKAFGGDDMNVDEDQIVSG